MAQPSLRAPPLPSFLFLSPLLFFASLSPVPLYPNGIPGGNVRNTRGEIQVGRDGERELTTHRKNLQGRNVEMRRQVKTVNRCRAGRRLIKSVPTNGRDVSSRFTNGPPSLTSTISRSVLVGSRSIETHRCRNVREESEKILDETDDSQQPSDLIVRNNLSRVGFVSKIAP